MEPAEYLDVAKQAAVAAGEVLLSWSDRFSVTEKGRADVVTEADFASQDVIQKLISEQFPDHGFFGEEGLSQPSRSKEANFRWIIDPLDGTSNYVHGFPYYCVSIGLEIDGELSLGVVYDPIREELFEATSTSPALLNGNAISTSTIPQLRQSLLVASLPRNTDPADPAVRRFLVALPAAENVQRTGSAALNLCYVACGRLDGFWSSSLKPWDMAGGVVITRRAGGTVTKLDGAAFDVGVPDLLVTNGTAIHDELVAVLSLS
ncbi:inositol monophosphatase family protein [Stratiformator vulcanicus]|uniref:Inositol-1-monophosphatase n=1 Tax=Stratiformator vulcanicus TaxID=2527980 RepID=A0A517R2P5_9PLAN|nr:inositol monophosphatase family protein [Stratiformator vulcanicus]QDT38138.1 Inositol-1-monophosphatase [Stratiformator vulcanicus]